MTAPERVLKVLSRSINDFLQFESEIPNVTT